MSPGRVSERALILAPIGRDTQVAGSMLAEAGIRAVPVASVTELARELDDGAAFAIVTEEALRSADNTALARWLASQEEWSDFPFILLTTRGGGLERNHAATRLLGLLGNVTFLERPFHPMTLVSVAQAALRGRRRQYDARARLEDLREGEERYRSLFDSIESGFCLIEMIFDALGRPVDFRYLETNPAFARQTGLGDAQGRTIRSLVPEYEDHWIELYGQVALSREGARFENSAPALGRWYDVYAFPAGDPGECRVAILFNDITDRRRIEEELRELTASLERRVEEATASREMALAQLHEAQKLETLGQLTGGVAHDFNNLLTPITGALDLLLRRFSDADPGAARLLTNAMDSAERAKILVQRLLGFARRQILETRPTDVRALLGGMGDLIASSIGSSIAIDWEFDALPPALVDPNQLELAILNLCVNSRDAMPDGGTLTISARESLILQNEVPGVAAGRYVSVIVADTGQGMGAEVIARAIEPFYSTKPIGKGTGLGLSMVHGLARQLGGGLRIASRIGAGTEIEILLPVTDAGDRPGSGDADGAAGDLRPDRSLRILLVDDQDPVRESVSEMLTELGHQVMQAGNGSAALDLAGRREFDIVVSDYKMPVMSGVQLASEIRAIVPGIAVLIITGYTGESTAFDLPHLQKPFRRGDLKRAIADAMGVGADP